MSTQNEQKNGKNGEDSRNLTVPYMLGELSASEETRFENTLRKGDPAAEELDELMDGLSALAEKVAANMPAPRKSLKERIMLAALGSKQEHPNSENAHNAPPHIHRADAEGWIDEPNAPGIRLNILFQDPTTKLFTVRVKLDPGATYPMHRHSGLEQCFILSGDLHVNDIDLAAGDFIVTDDGTMHYRTWTDNGCELLLTTSLADEILA